MKLDKAHRRDKKIYKKQHGMRIIGRSIFLIVENDFNRAEAILKKSKNIKSEDKLRNDYPF